MAARTLSRRIRDAVDAFTGKRGYDGASRHRFAPEARHGRTPIETIRAGRMLRDRARYFVANDGNAAAAVAALVDYGVGSGPMPAHSDSALADAFINEFWDACDADGRLNFGGLVALAFRATIIDGEALVIFRQRPDGLRLQLLPAEQLAEDQTRELGGGAFIAAGVEFDAEGRRVAYWIRPYQPTQTFETWAQPVRVDAADVLHLMRPDGIGQIRGVSWFAPILLKLADLGVLTDAMLKNIQVAALNSVYLIDKNGAPGMPFAGDKDGGDALDVSLEPGAARILRGDWDFKANTPLQAQQSQEFLIATIETIAAGLGVPAFMVSANVSRANYSSLRAALITFKAHLESIQYNLLVPQLLTPIWNRWRLTESLRNGGEADEEAPEWRFVPAPEADSVKAAQATQLLLQMNLMSRREAIAQRGESIERVDADINSDALRAQVEAAAEAEDEEESDDEA